MTLGDAALWGALGGIAVIGLEFWADIRKTRGVPQRKHRRIGYWLGELVRLVVGSIIAVALVDAQQVNGKLGALTAGIAAPLIVARLSQEIPRIRP